MFFRAANQWPSIIDGETFSSIRLCWKLFVVLGLMLLSCLVDPVCSLAQQPTRRARVTEENFSANDTVDPLQKKLSTVDAHPNDSKKTKKSTRQANSSGTMLRSVLGLAFVLCLILIGSAWVKKYVPQANKNLPSEAVQLLGQRPIGQRQLIQLVRCGSRILILGSTPQGLTTLGEVTDPVEVDYLAGLCQQEQPNSVTSAFSQLFQNYRDAGAEADAAANPLRSISNKLGLTRPAETTQERPVQTAREGSTSQTPEHTLKERMGRLGALAGSSTAATAKEESNG